MNDLEAGTFVMMVKNDDGSFSPVGLSKEQAYIIRTFLSKLSEDSPFIIKSEDRYVQTRDYQQKASDAAVSFFNNRAKKTNAIMVLPTGSGKSLICWKIIPLLLNHYCRKIVSCYDAQQMNADIDAVKAKHIIYIDDVGTENLSVKFGEKRLAFCEIVDEAEKRGKFLILTTNLSLDEISQKYGERTMDRLVAITTRVKFKGDSLRK